jgi:hypothetical protein
MRLTLHTRSLETAPVRGGPIKGAAGRAGRFGLHVLEMCVVMCVSLAVLGVVASAVTTTLGLSDVREEAPVLSALVVTAVLAGSMVAWMRFRGMEWRPTLEMAAPALAAGVLIIAGYLAGVIAEAALIGSVCGVACVGMVAVMLFRSRLYSSHSGQHAHAE